MQRTLILSMLCLAGTVAAQGERLDLQDDVPIDTYLALLAQVAPPARDGAVSPTARGQGLGLRLLSDCLQRAVASHPLITSAILLVNERWTSAARIYRQLGFAEIEAFTQFFTNADGSGSDGHVMRKRLTSSHA